ncbi:MAG TPA: LuxR C-terminal-related transcriptional regulator [Candidatus Limnocylindrales bacterium]|nr:LuxR C-terminal-related transcriptional regulator [Candidatus Limnocylindrales bacterium]
MTSADPLEVGRSAYDRQRWTAAHDLLTEADHVRPLDIEDLERLAVSAHMLRRTDDATRAWERAHLAAIKAGDPARAVRHAFHLIMGFGERGEMAQAGGWFARASAIAAELGPDAVESALLLVPQAIQALMGGDPGAALAMFDAAQQVADRHRDPDLRTLGRFGRGQALIALGEVERGTALLDEAMVAVTAGEVSPILAGTVYCASIEAFQEIFDLARAQEWTRALERWCDGQPDLIPFRGRCLVYRAELLRFHGLWQEAIEETRRATDWLSRPPVEPAVGEAHYQRGEMHRLRGEVAAAKRAYRDAGTWGRRPDPGLALLRLALGDVGSAGASIERALDEADDLNRTRLLEPSVDIHLARGNIAAARAAADELGTRTARFVAVLPRAIAARADGAVRLAEGDARAALAVLREAWLLWTGLDAPYESARVRVQIGLALRALRDHDAADLEFNAARTTFEDLGARPDLARLDLLTERAGTAPADRLSRRELEVLRHVAAGTTNRTIAAELGISERTVDRHVSNLFTKLGVTSRAAATATAYERGLV